jgi:translation initiation factor 2 subunit 2
VLVVCECERDPSYPELYPELFRISSVPYIPSNADEGEDGAAEGEQAGEGASPAAADASGAEGDADPSYETMLQNLYNTIYINNPELTERAKRKLQPPQVSRVGTTRSAWTNFRENCASLGRSMDHVMSFFLAELDTTGSIDASFRFIMKGRHLPKHIEALLRKYIAGYVSCSMCKSLDTELSRDPVSRLFFVKCKACESQRSVTTIKAGFHATTKGERKKARENA